MVLPRPVPEGRPQLLKRVAPLRRGHIGTGIKRRPPATKHPACERKRPKAFSPGKDVQRPLCMGPKRARLCPNLGAELGSVIHAVLALGP